MLIVVRHGRTEHNAAGRLLGRLDPPLDDLGRLQAAALARCVGPVDRVVTSPLRRARETAAAFGRDVEVDERWIELDYGDLDGQPLSQVDAEFWTRWRSDVSLRPPGGETLVELGSRVRGALEDLASGSAPGGGTTVVVTHVSPVKAAIGWALGVDDRVTWRMWVAQASLSRIEITARGPILHTFNEVAHLDGVALAEG